MGARAFVALVAVLTIATVPAGAGVSVGPPFDDSSITRECGSHLFAECVTEGTIDETSGAFELEARSTGATGVSGAEQILGAGAARTIVSATLIDELAVAVPSVTYELDLHVIEAEAVVSGLNSNHVRTTLAAGDAWAWFLAGAVALDCESCQALGGGGGWLVRSQPSGPIFSNPGIPPRVEDQTYTLTAIIYPPEGEDSVPAGRIEVRFGVNAAASIGGTVSGVAPAPDIGDAKAYATIDAQVTDIRRIL